MPWVCQLLHPGAILRASHWYAYTHALCKRAIRQCAGCVCVDRRPSFHLWTLPLHTAPASHILDRYFESDMLKSTLVKDAIVGAMCSPNEPGSAYVLLHHVMGTANGKEGVWAYVRGGMGAVSQSVARAAEKRGAELATNATVERILYEPVEQRRMGDPKFKCVHSRVGRRGGDTLCVLRQCLHCADPDFVHRAVGVRLADGTDLFAETVIANSTPYVVCSPYGFDVCKLRNARSALVWRFFVQLSHFPGAAARLERHQRPPRRHAQPSSQGLCEPHQVC